MQNEVMDISQLRKELYQQKTRRESRLWGGWGGDVGKKSLRKGEVRKAGGELHTKHNNSALHATAESEKCSAHDNI